MGYKLTLEQSAFILDLFYAGLSLRKISQIFRARYGRPLSPATILRRILCWVKDVDIAITYFLEKGEPGFELDVGDIWEIDEMHLPYKRGKLPFIVVRDLKTGFDLWAILAYTVTSDAIKTALIAAKAIAHKCPLELRCDGLPVYDSAVRDVFGSSTKLSIHKRVGKMGQNQSMEGHNGVFRTRFKAMRSLHSEEKSPIIMRGLVIDNNWVRYSTVLFGRTPVELALNKKPIDGKHSWLMLLELAEYYKRNTSNSRKLSGTFKGGDSTLDPFFNFEKPFIFKNLASYHYFSESREVLGDYAPSEQARGLNTMNSTQECPAPLRLDEQHEEGLLTKKGKWIFNRTEKQTTFDNSAQLIVENNKQTTLDDFSNSM